ncbi:MAG: ABC transporter substrate-binding protein [Nitrosomonas sp.]|jgi:phospholipid transport system substrate-binding protein|nr:ABC transporter substrate-binding protein [Nitrosomonas sp.]
MKAKQIIKQLPWMLILVSIILLPFISVIKIANAQEPESDSAYAAVYDLQQSLLQSMRDGAQLGFSGRVEFLTPVVKRTHDIDLIIKTIIGATLWNTLNQEQHDSIIETFRQLSIVTYAGQFKQYDGEQFNFIEQRDLPREQKLVRSQLIQNNGDIVNFDYVLHHTDGKWMIINILFDGVSDLAIKRSEYRSIMQRDGFQSLIDMLQVKIAEAEHTE